MPDFLVLNQIDSWPRCDNFIALVRTNGNLEFSNELRNFLEDQKLESAFNKLERARCPTLDAVNDA